MLGCWARGWTVNKWRLFSYRWMWFHHHVADALVRVQIAREKTTWSDHFINMIVALISATINDVPRSSYWKGRIQASSFPYMQPGSYICAHIICLVESFLLDQDGICSNGTNSWTRITSVNKQKPHRHCRTQRQEREIQTASDNEGETWRLGIALSKPKIQTSLNLHVWKYQNKSVKHKYTFKYIYHPYQQSWYILYIYILLYTKPKLRGSLLNLKV